jgi:uncharacterized protein
MRPVLAEEDPLSDRFPQLFYGLLALAIALIVAAFLGAQAIANFRTTDEITVTGSARKPIRSDFVVWRGTVNTQAPTPQEAYQDLRRHTDRIRAYLAQNGVADTLVTWRALESYPIHEYTDQGRETGRVLAYRLGQWFEVRSADVDGITRLADQSGELINEGMPFQGMSPEYLFTGLAEIRSEMLAAAAEDARSRADAIARSTGSRVGKVRNARMGVFQITPRNSTEVSDYGINDTSSLDKDITAVVRLTFGLR